MNILEDLWFGNISPWERPFRKDGAYAELLALVVRHQEDLLYRLNDEEKEIFEKFHDCWSEYMSLAEAAIFEYAFKIGARLAMEVQTGEE